MKIILFFILFFLYFQTYATGLSQNTSIKEMGEKIELLKEQISATPDNNDNIEKKEEKIELLETNTQILEKKVEVIKEQIDENNKKLENKINDILENKIKEKINNIKENEKYKKLDIKIKNNIFLNYIKLINLKIFDIKNSTITTSQKELKINILNTIKNLIEKELVN